MTNYILSNFEKRVLNILLDADEAGINLVDHNGERRTQDALIDIGLAKYGGGVDMIKLAEAQRSIGLVNEDGDPAMSAEGNQALGLKLPSEQLLTWAEAIEQTLTKAKELEAAGMLNEAGPPPSPAESNREILTARADALGV